MHWYFSNVLYVVYNIIQKCIGSYFMHDCILSTINFQRIFNFNRNMMSIFVVVAHNAADSPFQYVFVSYTSSFDEGTYEYMYV